MAPALPRRSASGKLASVELHVTGVPQAVSFAPMFGNKALAAAIGGLMACWVGTAAATEQGAPPQQSAAAADRAKSERRRLPDYDGRGSEPTTAGDVLLWGPRVILSPLYFVSEYVVRRPLGFVVSTAEERDWPAILVDFFTFGPDRNAGIIPTALLDFGLRPSVGLYFFSNDTFVSGNDVRLRAAFGGADWWQFGVTDRLALSSRSEISLRGEYQRRPDWLFFGFGPDSSDDLESNFQREEWSLELAYRRLWWRSSVLQTGITLRDVSYDLQAGCCRKPSLRERIDAGVIANPPGADDGFRVLTSNLTLTVDSRRERAPDELPEGSDAVAPPGTGVKVSFRGAHNIGLSDRVPFPGETPHKYHWLNYGATVAGFADITGRQRSVGLSLIADFTEPLSDVGAVPFDEHVSLGGPRPLSGFLEGRLRGRSATAAVMSYTWPIWVWLDGTLHYGVGNAFGPDLDGFAFSKLRSSFGIGISAVDVRDQAFKFLLAAGTETIEDGMAAESLRILLGTTDGF